jgi:hypothetical protein
MRRTIGPILLLALGAAGCRGVDYYADKPPLEIAEMVDVQHPGEGSGEVRYSAPTIAARRSYRLAGRRDFETGAITHELRLTEAGSSEARFLEWAETTFGLVDRQTSCYPREDCDTDVRTYKKRYRDKDGDKKTRLVERVYRDCDESWRCRSERLYEVAIDDGALRQASPLGAGMAVELSWDCGRGGGHADTIELPASYLQGYLLAVDGYPHTPRPAPAPPEPRLSSP